MEPDTLIPKPLRILYVLSLLGDPAALQKRAIHVHGLKISRSCTGAFDESVLLVE